MNIMVRLYARHDLDLIALKKNTYFDFNKCLKLAVIAWARGDKYTIPSPTTKINDEELKDIKPIGLHFSLGKSEEDVIEALKHIKYGYRNSFLKNLFRYYMSEPILNIYLDSTNNVCQNQMKNTPTEDINKGNYEVYEKVANNEQKVSNDINDNTDYLPKENIKPLEKADNDTESVEIVKTEEPHNPLENIMNTTNNSENNEKKNDDNADFDLFGALGSMM